MIYFTTFCEWCYCSFRNPMGRTGLKGRGILRRYGPNHLLTAVITR